MSGGGPSVPSGPLTGRRPSIASALRTSLARHSCTALAPSVVEPPPTVTIRSAPASRAISAASITACRGVCGGMWSNRPANRLLSARRTLAISSVVRFSVPLTIRKDPLSVAPSRLLGDRLGGGLAEHHRFHRAKRDSPGLQHGFLLGSADALWR